MHEIIKECTLGGVTFLDHANSLLIIVESNIRNIHLIKANECLHMGLQLHRVDDGLRNFVCSLKDWHEIMLSHSSTRKLSHE
jgi:hypothetical protein